MLIPVKTTLRVMMQYGRIIGVALAAMVIVNPVSAQEQPLTVETLAEGLNHPWALAFLPDGTMLVTERNGKLRQIRNGQLVDEPVANVPETFAEGQGGFFDILPDPEFATNRYIYLSFAHGKRSENMTRIVRAKFDVATLSDLTVLFDSSARATNAHFGGRMVFMNDGTLLLTTGDGFEYREKAQRKDSTLGKIVRINRDGSIPEDNPFVGLADHDPAIWTLGHRSPQGLARDEETGTIYMHEHGPQGGDEINIVTRASNYGWPIATYGIDYSGASISPFKDYAGTVQPIKYWVPSIAPSGLAVYRGSAFSNWNGNLLVGALAGKALHRIGVENGKAVSEEILLEDLDERIRDVRVGPDGYVYLTTDSPDGKILRIVPRG